MDFGSEKSSGEEGHECNEIVRIPVMGCAALSHQEIITAQHHKRPDACAISPQ